VPSRLYERASGASTHVGRFAFSGSRCTVALVVGRKPQERSPGGEGPELTSFHLQRARKGDEESLAWLVVRLTPLLRVQARYRVQGALRRLYSPDDLVNEVWLIALPRMADLIPRDGHCTPVLLRFLATTLLNIANNHLTRYLRTDARTVRSGSTSRSPGLSRGLPSLATSVLGSVTRNEAQELLEDALEGLEADERELLVLRGIEQHANQEVADRLGIEPSTATRRYQRVLGKLQARLPGSIFDELPS